MRTLVIQILCFTLCEVVLSAADSALSEDKLKKLSAAGERLVHDEIKRALLGLKQAKETMEQKEERHAHLMDGLRRSNDKRKGALQLVQESQQKLTKAEHQCEELTKSSFDECRPCLEDTCKAFFTSTCRRGFAAFSFKVEEFFRKMAAQLDPAEAAEAEAPPSDEGQSDVELLQADQSFHRLLSDAGLLYGRAVSLAQGLRHVFAPSFLAAFDGGEAAGADFQSDSSEGFLRTAALDRVLDSMYDFRRNMLEELSSAAVDVLEVMQEAEEYFQQSSRGSLSSLDDAHSRFMCRRLRREVSECWQFQDLCETCQDYLLKECPSVQQLHSEMEELHMLLNASRQQYNDRLQLLRRHTGDAQALLSGVREAYGWVNDLAHVTPTFTLITVIPHYLQVKNLRPKPDTSVVVSVLDSAPLTLLVPAELEVDDPAFIQFTVQEALSLWKQQIRGPA